MIIGELSSPSGQEPKQSSKSKINNNYKLPTLDPKTNSYIPPSTPTNSTPDSKLPPICVSTRTEFKYSEVSNNEQLIERLQTQQLKFMIQRNFYVLVKIINCEYKNGEKKDNQIELSLKFRENNAMFINCLSSNVLYQ